MSSTQTDLTPDNKHRDEEILRLWLDGWSARKIAKHLDIEASTVAGLIHRNKAARKPRGEPVIRTADLDDAPVAAWQQAMLPKLEQIADDAGFGGAAKRAVVFLYLLRLKPHEDIEGFKTWVREVTGYDRLEIADFVEYGMKNFLIVDGQPNAAAFPDAGIDDETGYVALVMLAGVLQGRVGRTADDEYFLAEETV